MTRSSYPLTHPVEQFYPPASGLRIRPRSAGNYIQTCNVVYAESHGIGLVMDVFEPESASNGLGIVDVVAGAWHSDRVRLNEHIGLGAIDVFCGLGFTVFAVRPGSATLFTAEAMVKHIHGAIRYVKAQASAYRIDGERLGLVGVSAGGHLAALAALGPEASHPHSREAARHQATDVAAVGLVFAPTDFAQFDEFSLEEAQGLPISGLLFEDGVENHGKDEIAARLKALSPLERVHAEAPPFYLLHGTADPIVPHRHSEGFAGALKKAKVEVKLQLKEGGGHPWPDARPELEVMGIWLQKKLGG